MTSSVAPATLGPTSPTRPKRARKWLLRGGIGAGLAAVAVVAGLRVAARPSTPKLHYETAAVDHGPVSAKVTATGTLSALVMVSVGSQVSGRIATLGADFESQVHKGQIVATIDPELFRAAVNQARANYLAAKASVDRARATKANTQKQFARASALLAAGVLSRQDYDAAEAANGVADADIASAQATVAQSAAALSQAELNLHYTTIVSPIDGVVISRNVDIGQTVAAAFQAPTLFTIAQDLTKMQVDTNVAEADVGKIRADMDVTFTVDAYPGRAFPGRVRQVRDNAQTIQNVVTYDAVIDVDNGERFLKPGMTANVTFVYAAKGDVTRVSNGALRFRPDAATERAMGVTVPTTSAADERVLWLLRGAPVATVVRVGISDGAVTEIVDGQVSAGDAAILEVLGAGAKKGP